MKIIYTFLAGSILLAACNTNPKENLGAETAAAPGVTVLADTNGLAQFQAWKTAQLVKANEAEKETVVKKAAAKKPVRRASYTSHQSTAPRTVTYQSGSETVTPDAPVTVPQEQKKGWSKAAKGAAIGAGAGAIVGAIAVKKNRALGGVIGGVVGGAVGYGIGRSQDKKDGRY